MAAPVPLVEPGMAVIYARTSTDLQEREETVVSQIDACQAYCATSGIRGTHRFVDDGVSGTDLRRPALSRLRDLARQGAVQTLVAYDVDRLSRNLFHLLLLIEEFEGSGAEVRFVRSPREDSAESRVLFHIKGVFAEYEREKIRERTLRGKVLYIKHGGWFGRPPYGYRVVNQHLKVDPKEARWLEEMFSLYADGTHTLHGVAAHLNANSVPTRHARSPGKDWQGAVVGRILGRELYTGTLRRRIKAIPESACEVQVPPLIDQATWGLVQARFSANRAHARRNRTRFYLLSGLVRCDVCQRQYYGRHCKRADTRHYRCATNHSRVRFPEPCRSRGVRADSLEAAIWDRRVLLVTRRKGISTVEHLPAARADDRKALKAVRGDLAAMSPTDKRGLCQLLIQEVRIGSDRKVHVEWVMSPSPATSASGAAQRGSSFRLPRRQLSAEARANLSIRSRAAVRRRIAAGLFVSPSKDPAAAAKISAALLRRVKDGTWQRPPAPRKDPATGRWLKGRADLTAVI